MTPTGEQVVAAYNRWCDGLALAAAEGRHTFRVSTADSYILLLFLESCARTVQALPKESDDS